VNGLETEKGAIEAGPGAEGGIPIGSRALAGPARNGYEITMGGRVHEARKVVNDGTGGDEM
jgi:hypothetical protein